MAAAEGLNLLSRGALGPAGSDHRVLKHRPRMHGICIILGRHRTMRSSAGRPRPGRGRMAGLAFTRLANEPSQAPSFLRLAMKLTYRRFLSILCALVMGLHLLVLAATPVRAQFFDDSQDQEDAFVQDEDTYFEDTGTGSLPVDQGTGAASEQDYTEGNKYVDENLVPLSQRIPTQSSRRLQLSLGAERQTLPLNVAWGAGTGLLIGGWFALIGQGNNRQTQRSIGMGIVTGILLGMAVGTRTLFDPNAPKAAQVGDNAPPPDEGSHVTPLVALNKTNPQVGFQLRF